MVKNSFSFVGVCILLLFLLSINLLTPKLIFALAPNSTDLEISDSPSPSDTSDSPSPSDTSDSPSPSDTSDSPSPSDTSDSPSPSDTSDSPSPSDTSDSLTIDSRLSSSAFTSEGNHNLTTDTSDGHSQSDTSDSPAAYQESVLNDLPGEKLAIATIESPLDSNYDTSINAVEPSNSSFHSAESPSFDNPTIFDSSSTENMQGALSNTSGEDYSGLAFSSSVFSSSLPSSSNTTSSSLPSSSNTTSSSVTSSSNTTSSSVTSSSNTTSSSVTSSSNTTSSSLPSSSNTTSSSLPSSSNTTSSSLPSSSNTTSSSLPSSSNTTSSSLPSSSNTKTFQVDESPTIPNSLTQPIGVGDNQVVSFRDVSDPNNSTQTVTIAFDKSQYLPTDVAILTVTDLEANLDPSEVNTIIVGIGSTSDTSGILLQLIETGPNTEVFQSNFTLVNTPSTGNSLKTQAGDKITVFYFASHARLKAVYDGVVTPGSAVITDYFVPATDTLPFDPIGGAAQIVMQDTQVADEGMITILMSYANANLGGQHEDELLMFYGQPIMDASPNWMNLRDDVGATVTVNPIDKTVTAVIPVSLFSDIANSGGLFILGVPGSGGGGCGVSCGSTGGPALGGTGVVLDFLVPIMLDEGGQNPPPSSPPTLALRDTVPELLPVDSNVHSTNETTNQKQTFAQEFPKISSNPTQTVTRSSSQTINITKMVPGVGPVLFELVGLTTPDININIINSNLELALLGLKPSPDFPGTLVANVSGSNYIVVGKILNISSEKLAGEAELTVPYDKSLYTEVIGNINAKEPFIKIGEHRETLTVDLLHFTGQKWEVVTSEVGELPHSVTGKVSSLGPVVAAIKTDS